MILHSQTFGQDGRGYKACGLSDERAPFKMWPPRKYVARVWIWKGNLSIVWCNANVCWPQTKMTDQIWRSWIDFMICSITSPRNLSWKRASWNLAWENNWRVWPSTPGPCSFRCISPDSTMSQTWQQLRTSYRRQMSLLHYRRAGAPASQLTVGAASRRRRVANCPRSSWDRRQLKKKACS